MSKKFYATEFHFHNFVDGCTNWDTMLLQINEEKEIVLALKEMDENKVIERESCDSHPSLVRWTILDFERYKSYAKKCNLYTYFEPALKAEEIGEMGLVPVEE